MDIIKIDDYYFYEEEEVPNEMILTGYNLSQGYCFKKCV